MELTAEEIAGYREEMVLSLRKLADELEQGGDFMSVLEKAHSGVSCLMYELEPDHPWLNE